MTNISSQRNIGGQIAVRLGSTPATAVTAAGAGDNTTKTGVVIDRENFGQGVVPESMVVAVLYSATLASGATLSVSIDVMDSADNSAFSDFASVAAAVVATGPSGGGAVTGQVSFNVDLTGARRYVRPAFIPDLSAAGTDTAQAIAVVVVGGFDEVPAPA